MSVKSKPATGFHAAGSKISETMSGFYLGLPAAPQEIASAAFPAPGPRSGRSFGDGGEASDLALPCPTRLRAGQGFAIIPG